jgi:hypothetical protein
MITATVYLLIALYVLVAMAFVRYVWRRTPKKYYRWLAISIAILLPVWDVVLGYLAYYPV